MEDGGWGCDLEAAEEEDEPEQVEHQSDGHGHVELDECWLGGGESGGDEEGNDGGAAGEGDGGGALSKREPHRLVNGDLPL